jgi:hypothetical protein
MYIWTEYDMFDITWYIHKFSDPINLGHYILSPVKEVPINREFLQHVNNRFYSFTYNHTTEFDLHKYYVNRYNYSSNLYTNTIHSSFYSVIKLYLKDIEYIYEGEVIDLSNSMKNFIDYYLFCMFIEYLANKHFFISLNDVNIGSTYDIRAEADNINIYYNESIYELRPFKKPIMHEVYIDDIPF